MTYFKKDHNGSPAIYNDDGLVAVFEIEEERDGFLDALDVLWCTNYSIRNNKVDSGAVLLGYSLEAKTKSTMRKLKFNYEAE